MDEKLVNIINEMAEYLNIAQMKKLQEVLLRHLISREVECFKSGIFANVYRCEAY